MGDSTKFLAKSPYIKDLAMMVIGYGMAINIVEVTWKSKLKAAFPDPNSYSVFMGNFSSLTGIVTLLMMIGSRTIFKVCTTASRVNKFTTSSVSSSNSSTSFSSALVGA